MGVPGSAPFPLQCSQRETASNETSRLMPSSTSASSIFDGDGDVAARRRPAAPKPEQLREQRVALAEEGAEDVLEPGAGGRPRGEAAGAQALVPERVVGPPALRVGQDLIRLGRLLELLLGGRVVLFTSGCSSRATRRKAFLISASAAPRSTPRTS